MQTIRLIHNGPAELPLGVEHFVILTGNMQAEAPLETYRGPVTFASSIEWRPVLPYGNRSCRVLSLGNLRLPEEADFFLLRCTSSDFDGAIHNEHDHLVELVRNRRLHPGERGRADGRQSRYRRGGRRTLAVIRAHRSRGHG